MAQQTFAQIWQKVLLYAPGTPVGLVQQFVRNAYHRALNSHSYSELMADGEHVIASEYSDGSITLVNGSATVLGAGTTFTSAHEGLQLRVTDNDSIPWYTVATFVGVGEITLDRVWQGPDLTGALYTLGEYYIEFPSDLDNLDDIRDVTNNWRLRRQFHQQNYIDFVDARRENTGTPVLYVAAPPRVAEGVSYPRFEFWPRPPAGTHLVYRYTRVGDIYNFGDYPVTVMDPEALVYGALAELCIWPGTGDRKNPFFDLELHKKYTDLYDDAIHDAEMADLERSQRMVHYDDAGMGYPNDAAFAQAHGLVPE